MPSVISQDMQISGLYFSSFNFMAVFTLSYGALCGLAYLAQKIYISKFLDVKIKPLDESKGDLNNFESEPIEDKQQSSQNAMKYLALTLCFLKQGLVTLLMFSIFNLSFASNLLHKYVESSPNVILSRLSIYLTGIVAIAVLSDFVYSGNSASSYGEFKEEFKVNWVCRMYLVISLFYRLAIGISISSDM